MAKRFTDTEKWDDPWFRRLPPILKVFWDYLCTKCDLAGVWKVDLDAAEFHIGQKLDEKEISKALCGRVVKLDADTKWFVVQFIDFQYGTLSEDCKPHKAVIKRIEKHGIPPEILALSKGYPKGIHTLKDKDKDKVNRKGQGEGLSPTEAYDISMSKEYNVILEDWKAISGQTLIDGCTRDGLIELAHMAQEKAVGHKQLKTALATFKKQKDAGELDRWTLKGFASNIAQFLPEEEKPCVCGASSWEVKTATGTGKRAYKCKECGEWK